jgi:UDP-3-O-[3-hydroxymyristoyl] glucosamine N-acyltransferase
MPNLTIETLAKALDASFEGDGSLVVSRPVHPGEADAPGTIAIATSPEFVAKLKGAQAAVLAEGVDWQSLGLKAALFVGRPRYALSGVTTAFAPEISLKPGVHAAAIVDPTAKLGKDVSVGPFAYIGAGASIGAGSRIHSHASVGADAQLGEDALIHSGARLGDRVSVGARAIIHQNAVIGADGFSFVTPQMGAVEAAKAGGGSTSATQNTSLARIHSLGAVTLGDDVEIGACTTIDRGTLTNTRIGSGTKLDNQVQIGHNVQIGETCMLCAQVGIAGSAVVGDRVVLGGKTGVADHVTIGSDVLVGAASAVATNIPSRNIMMGVPAVKRDEALRGVMALRRLPRLFDTVDGLKKRLSALDGDR